MRLLHTSDWHLGKRLVDNSRKETFDAFLNWLLTQLKDLKVDVLIIAGDIFDTSMPSHQSQEQYYRFLARAVRSGCKHIIVTGGNHDSASFLNAPKTIIEMLNIHVIGDAKDNPEEEVVEIKNDNGELQAVVCAVPYLRERDFFSTKESDSFSQRDELILAAMAKHYEAVVQVAKEKMKGKKVPLIATGHLFVSGGNVSKTERDLYIGSLGQVPVDIIPAEIDYLALGHLHRPQIVGGDTTKNYCGSPIALDFSEGQQKKIVRLVDFEDDSVLVKDVEVPQFDRLVHVEGTKSEIIERLSGLIEEKVPCLVEVEHKGIESSENLIPLLRAMVKDTDVEILIIRDTARKQQYLASMVNEEFVAEMTPESVFQKLIASTLANESYKFESEEQKQTYLKDLQECYCEILHEVLADEVK